MKNISLILFFFFGIMNASFTQDVITKTNGDQIEAKVLEIGRDVIKYNKSEDSDGIIYNIKKSDVFMIKYKNGTKDVFGLKDKKEPQENELDAPTTNDQKNNRKGYYAITLGPAIPIGDFGNNMPLPTSGYAKVGGQISLANFGYLFTKVFGITANLQGGALKAEVTNFNGNYDVSGPWKFVNILVGPLLSYPTKNINVDFRLMIGLLMLGPPYIEAINDDNPSNTYSYTIMWDDYRSSFSIDIGLGLRMHASKNISFIFSFDYLYGKPEIHMENHNQRGFKFQIINISGGIAFRLK